MRLRTLFTLIATAVATVPLAAQETRPLALDPELPYQAERRNPVVYDVDFSVVVTAPYKTKSLRVWLPVPRDDRGQQVRNSRLSTFPSRAEPQVGQEPVFGNTFAYFEFASPAGAQIIRHQFQITVWELHWNVDPEQVVSIGHWPSSFDPYRRGETQAVVVDERFGALLNEIVPRRVNLARDFGSVLVWTQNNLTYDHHDASLRASSVHALEKRRGHCSDYHGLCASLGRELGVPTRVTYGINPFPKNSPSHCKLEAFLPPYGWVSFDVSETQKLMGKVKTADGLDDERRATLIAAAQSRLARGFRDNTWYLQTRGTDYELAPAASQRVPVVRTAYIEADGVPLPEPDPADAEQRAFSWMTVHEYRADRNVPYPFADISTLDPESSP